MTLELPRGTLFPVRGIDIRLIPDPHPFERDNLAAIDANWKRETQARPALFDGQVMLFSRLRLEGENLAGECHAVRFASFMLWRRSPAATGAGHLFGHAALVCLDGTLLAIRMGSHTANAGRVYFAAGSLEPDDFTRSSLDLERNMAREVAEETGLRITGLEKDAGYLGYAFDTGTVLFRRYRLGLDADDAAKRVQEFVACQREPEIEGPVVIRKDAPAPSGLADYMLPFIDWHYANLAGRRRKSAR